MIIVFRLFLVLFVVWGQFFTVTNAISEDEDGGILLFLSSIIAANPDKDQTTYQKISSFPIAWPFPQNTMIRGIVYFDHNQIYNFNNNLNDNNGLGLTYFCSAYSTMPWFQHMLGDQGEFLVGITDGHRGNDFFIPLGTPILAVADGTVEIETGHPIEEDRIKIVHDNGWITLYAHSIIRDGSLHGQRVSTGDQIGIIANTGTGGVVTIDSMEFYELHFELIRPNPSNTPQYSSVDPFFGDCSNKVANPEQKVYWKSGVPLNFIPKYFNLN